MKPADAPGSIDIELAWAPEPRVVVRVRLRLRAGATVHEAVAASGLADGQPALAEWRGDPAGSALTVAVWGRRATPSQALRERDRVEILRPLTVDPKEARRQRYKGGAARGAGGRRAADGKVSGSPTK